MTQQAQAGDRRGDELRGHRERGDFLAALCFKPSKRFSVLGRKSKARVEFTFFLGNLGTSPAGGSFPSVTTFLPKPESFTLPKHYSHF